MANALRCPLTEATHTADCPAEPGFAAWRSQCANCSCEISRHWDDPATHTRLLAHCCNRNVTSSAGMMSPLAESLRGDSWCNWMVGVPQPWSTEPLDAPSVPTLIFGVHLQGGTQVYRPLRGGSHPRNTIDNFLKASVPAAEGVRHGWLQVHVVHDSSQVNETREQLQPGVVLHKVVAPFRVGNTSLAATDARWAAFQQVLRRERPPPGSCVFMIDITDVRLLQDPRSLCLAHPGALFVGSDMCSMDGARTFLRYQISRSGYKPSDKLHTLLTLRQPPYIHNAGIIGGRLSAVVEPFIHRLADETQAHYAQHQHPNTTAAPYVMDAALLNDLLLSYVGPIYGGFPRGLVNLPMVGDACVPVKFNPFCRAARISNCTSRMMIGAMSRNYFFTHKLGCGTHLPCNTSMARGINLLDA